jgi:FkbM family methyltransferase
MKTYKLPNGTRIRHMNKSETDLIYQEIFEEEIYLRGGVEIKDGDTIIDIGANVGLFLLFLSDRFQNLRVFSYEPIPATFAVLKENAATAKDGNQFHLFNQGVSGKPGTATFDFMPRFSCSSTMRPDHSLEQGDRAREFTLNAFEQLPNRVLAGAIRLLPGFAKNRLADWTIRYHTKAEKVVCQLTTMPEILRQNQLASVDVLKVDAEGAEIEILEAMDEESWKAVRQAMVETHRGAECTQRVVDILSAQGFQTTVDHSPSSPADEMVYAIRR